MAPLNSSWLCRGNYQTIIVAGLNSTLHGFPSVKFFAEQRDYVRSQRAKIQTLIIGHGRYLVDISSWSGASSPLNYVVRVACSSEDTGSTTIAGVSRAGAGRGIFEYSQADYLA